MFDLAYPLNETVDIDGITYDLDLSFSNVLRLIDLLNDEELTAQTQIDTGLYMLIGTELGNMDYEQKEEILFQIFNEAVGNNDENYQNVDIEGNPMPNAGSDNEKEQYSLKQDAAYIYASFMKDYHIDLKDEADTLHWDKFVALLHGLSEDTIFKQVLNIRTCELPTGKGTEKERSRIKKLKKIYELKQVDE